MVAPDTIVQAVTDRDATALRRALGGHAGRIPAKAVVEAGRLGWRPGLEMLARHGADLDASYRRYRAVHALIQERPHADERSTPERVACLEWLLAHGADPDAPGGWPAARAVIVAAASGERAYVQAFGTRYRHPDVFVASALGRAARVGDLIARDPALATARDGGVLTALHCAALSRLGRADARVARGLCDVAAHLVAAGADVNATVRSWGQDVSVAYFAIRSRQHALLDLLLDHGLDPTDAISPAAWDGQFDVVDRLMARGATIDDARVNGRPVLNDLIRWGQCDAARALLARGASPNVPDDRGWTAMHQAASRGNARLWQDLLDAGGDQTRTDDAGATPADVSGSKRRQSLTSA